MDIESQPSKMFITNMIQERVIDELPGPHSTLWRESDHWSFPKEDEITCHKCNSYGVWQEVIPSPSDDPDEPMTQQYSVCVLGCLDCVKENGWTWGEQKQIYHSSTPNGDIQHFITLIPIPANGIYSHDFNEEINNIELLEEMVHQVWDHCPDYQPPLWERFYNMIPDRLYPILNDIFHRTTPFPGNHEMEPGYAQEIHNYLQEYYNDSIQDIQGREKNENSIKVKEYCRQVIDILDNINQDIPEGKYLELLNIVGEIHKCQ
jgi:hypothetical protein